MGRAREFDAVGGMQNHTAQLTRELDQLGVRQTVLTAWRPDVPRTERVERHSTVQRLGWPVRRFRQLYSGPAAVAVVRAGAAHDLVHAHLGEDLAVVSLALLASRPHRRPLVITVHASLRHTVAAADSRARVLRLLGGPLERWGEQRADAVIVLTRRLRERLEAEGLPARALHVIPSGIDPGLLDVPRPDPLPRLGRPRVVFIGRLAAQKGVATLLHAVARMRHQGIRLVLVGDGPLRADLERQARALAIADRTVFVGQVAHREVPAYLQHGEVLALPSIYEELGSVLLEAMRTGIAIVATRVGGIPEVIRNGDQGLLVAPNDPAALTAALDRVVANAALRRRLGTAARDCSDRYRWVALAERILSVYRTVVAG